MNELAIQIVSGVVVPLILGLIAWIFRRAIQDLKSHMIPNGGSSVWDQARDAKELASKAVEISLLNEARLKQLEQKIDAIILSRLQ